MHQNVFGGRALPRPAAAVYSAAPDLLAELRGRGGERSGKRGGEGEGRGSEKKWEDPPNV